MKIISKGRCVELTSGEIAEIPANNWFRYNQLRLTLSHAAAIAKLLQK